MQPVGKCSQTASVTNCSHIVENATQHESDSLFNLLEELKWTDTVSLPATFESYMSLRGKLTDADLCTSFESGIQRWIGRYVAAFGYLTPSYLCTSNSKVSKGAVTTLYWMIDEVTQASRGLNYKFSALNKQGLFDFTSPLQDIRSSL